MYIIATNVSVITFVLSCSKYNLPYALNPHVYLYIYFIKYMIHSFSGIQLNYKCVSGYQSSGFSKAMCVGEGRWVNPTFQCLREYTIMTLMGVQNGDQCCQCRGKQAKFACFQGLSRYFRGMLVFRLLFFTLFFYYVFFINFCTIL